MRVDCHDTVAIYHSLSAKRNLPELSKNAPIPAIWDTGYSAANPSNAMATSPFTSNKARQHQQQCGPGARSCTSDLLRLNRTGKFNLPMQPCRLAAVRRLPGAPGEPSMIPAVRCSFCLLEKNVSCSRHPPLVLRASSGQVTLWRET